MLPTWRQVSVSNTFVTLPSASPVAELRINMLRMAFRAMLGLTNLGSAGRKRWCTAIVLVAICALTVSVATRYGSAVSGNDAARAIETHSSWEPGLQRLLDNAVTWIPPVVADAVFYAPAYYRHVAPSGPTVSSVVLEKNLYNRPPPA